MTSLIVLERILEKTKNKSISPIMFPYINSSLGTTTPTLWRVEIFSKKSTFCKKPTQKHATQYHVLFVIYHEVFFMETGIKSLNVVVEEPSFTRSSLTSPFVFDSVEKKTNNTCFHWRISFGTKDHDARIDRSQVFPPIIYKYFRPSKNWVHSIISVNYKEHKC